MARSKEQPLIKQLSERLGELESRLYISPDEGDSLVDRLDNIIGEIDLQLDSEPTQEAIEQATIAGAYMQCASCYRRRLRKKIRRFGYTITIRI